MTLAYTAIVAGIIIILLGYFWQFPHVTPTTGVVVESTMPSYTGRGTVRLLTYDYTAYGVHHRGQRYLRYAPHYEGMFKAGSSLSVYFVSEHPEVSYAPNPPRVLPLIVVGIMLAAGGGATIMLGWRR